MHVHSHVNYRDSLQMQLCPQQVWLAIAKEDGYRESSARLEEEFGLSCGAIHRKADSQQAQKDDASIPILRLMNKRSMRNTCRTWQGRVVSRHYRVPMKKDASER